MTSNTHLHTPQFKVGDEVLSLAHDKRIAVVVEVCLDSTEYRYVVKYSDNTTSVFYGFELQPLGRRV